MPDTGNIAVLEIDDPYSSLEISARLEPAQHADGSLAEGEPGWTPPPRPRIAVITALKEDPLGRMHARRQIDRVQFLGGRGYQELYDATQRGHLPSVDLSRTKVDFGRPTDPLTDKYQRASRRLRSVDGTVLQRHGETGLALVRAVLCERRPVEQTARSYGAASAHETRSVAWLFRQVLNVIARALGFATAARPPYRPTLEPDDPARDPDYYAEFRRSARCRAAARSFVANGGTQFTGPGNTFMLTTGQDTLTGYGHDVFNAPLSTTISGIPPTQIPTLQTGDSLIDISPDTGNVLNATFNPAQTGEFVTNTTTFTESISITESFVLTLAASFGIGEHGSLTFATSFGIAITESLSESQSQSFTFPVTGVNYVNATIEGIGTWNLTATAPNTVTAINGGPNVTGVNDIEMINSSGGFFDIGSTTGLPSGGNNFAPLTALVATISATNDTGGNKFWLSGIDVSQQESLFTPTTSVQINLSNAGSGPPATDTFSQAKVRGINQSLFIGDGPSLMGAARTAW